MVAYKRLAYKISLTQLSRAYSKNRQEDLFMLNLPIFQDGGMNKMIL